MHACGARIQKSKTYLKRRIEQGTSVERWVKTTPGLGQAAECPNSLSWRCRAGLLTHVMLRFCISGSGFESCKMLCFLFFEFTISANLAISAWLTWCMYAVGHSIWVLQCICVCALICRRYMLPHGCYICVHIASLSVFDIHIWWFDRSDMLFYCTEAHWCMCCDIERCY